MDTHYPNPLLFQRADPYAYRHTDNLYYFTATSPKYDCIELRVSATLAGLQQAEPHIVWEKHAHGPMSQMVWAPEIHYVRGKWYLYFAAAPTTRMHPGHQTFQHRMFVLQAEDPVQGPWVEKGQLESHLDTFCLDATVFESGGRLLCAWAQKDPAIHGNSNIYLSEMENPWTLKGQPLLLSRPEYPWECSVIPVNEGPAFLRHGGRVFLAFSANATGSEYCVGLLYADEADDLLAASSWHKLPEPVFGTSRENQKYGPGHNSFTVAEDGKTPLILYHARNYLEIAGDPLDNPDRHACAQAFTFNEAGLPVFGAPLPAGRADTPAR